MSELPELDEVLAPGRGFMHLDDDQTAFASARVVVVPVPFDATTCYRRIRFSEKRVSPESTTERPR